MSAEPRRILAVVRNPVGGIRTYLKYTYGALNPARYRFTVLAVKSDESSQLHSDLSSLPARIVEVDSAPDLAQAVQSEALKGAHDLVHSHGLRSGACASPGVWVSHLMPLVRRLPHVITSHDVFLPSEFSGPKGLVVRAGLTFVLNRASAVHSVSPGADRNLAEYLPGLRASRRHVVLNGIPPAPVDDEAEARRWRGETAPGGERLFGFFGRFMPQKGFEYVIDAAARLQSAPATRDRFRVVAVNDGSYIRERRAEIEKLGLSDRFVFTGFVPQARRLMERVDAVLMPSLWEACGLVAMEAMAAGTPLISTAVHGLADVTAESPALVVEPRSGAALAQAMTSLIERPEAFRAQARDFRDTARGRFDVAAAAAGLEKIFDRFLLPSELRN